MKLVSGIMMLAAGTKAEIQGPGNGPWELVSPESQGVSSAALEGARDFVFNDMLEDGVPARGCLVVVKGGKLIFEDYQDIPSQSYTVDTVQNGFSMSKTLAALIVGVGVTDGMIDIDADITQAYGVTSPRPYPVTTRGLLNTAEAGSNGEGEAWSYCSGISTNIDVVRAATNSTPGSIWEDRLQGPLGMSDFFSHRFDTTFGTGTAGSCRDYARAGQLILNKGQWAGHGSLVSESFVEEITSPHKFGPYDYANSCYGFLTWINTNKTDYPLPCIGSSWPEDTEQVIPGGPTDASILVGANGQITMVLPSQNAVIVSMGRLGGGAFGAGSRGIARGVAYGVFPALGLQYDGEPAGYESFVPPFCSCCED